LYRQAVDQRRQSDKFPWAQITQFRDQISSLTIPKERGSLVLLIGNKELTAEQEYWAIIALNNLAIQNEENKQVKEQKSEIDKWPKGHFYFEFCGLGGSCTSDTAKLIKANPGCDAKFLLENGTKLKTLQSYLYNGAVIQEDPPQTPTIAKWSQTIAEG
jgi:hypothetical protein